jgi:hypothetical protein
MRPQRNPVSVILLVALWDKGGSAKSGDEKDRRGKQQNDVENACDLSAFPMPGEGRPSPRAGIIFPWRSIRLDTAKEKTGDTWALASVQDERGHGGTTRLSVFIWGNVQAEMSHSLGRDRPRLTLESGPWRAEIIFLTD